jgi:hypothetical protein
MTNTRDDEARTDSVGAWLRAAVADAERRGLPELGPMLESLAESTRGLRAAEWNEHVPNEGGPGTAHGGAEPRAPRESPR